MAMSCSSSIPFIRLCAVLWARCRIGLWTMFSREAPARLCIVPCYEAHCLSIMMICRQILSKIRRRLERTVQPMRSCVSQHTGDMSSKNGWEMMRGAHTWTQCWAGKPTQRPAEKLLLYIALFIATKLSVSADRWYEVQNGSNMQTYGTQCPAGAEFIVSAWRWNVVRKWIGAHA